MLPINIDANQSLKISYISVNSSVNSSFEMPFPLPCLLGPSRGSIPSISVSYWLADYTYVVGTIVCHEHSATSLLRNRMNWRGSFHHRFNGTDQQGKTAGKLIIIRPSVLLRSPRISKVSMQGSCWSILCGQFKIVTLSSLANLMSLTPCKIPNTM